MGNPYSKFPHHKVDFKHVFRNAFMNVMDKFPHHKVDFKRMVNLKFMVGLNVSTP